MNKKNRSVSASGALLAIAFALLSTGRLSAGEDDAKAEKAIEFLGGRGRVVRSPGPIISVDLNGTQVTDAGLKELAGLKSLQTLSLVNTQVTAAGMVELRKALPKCVINR